MSKLIQITDKELAEQIDIFESQIELKKQGKIDDKMFAEIRLRKGVYGQRYDNGFREFGDKTQKFEFPESELKGPETVWDAPGMLRIKIPFGKMNPVQMRVLADLAEEYANSILHITTRQDIQYHYIHIDDTPTIMRRLASVGITTHEACGNVIRNVTACPRSGVCSDEVFDVSPYAQATTQYMLNHPDCQDFGRKFKIAFSGCSENACGLVNMHDLGLIAKIEKGEKGFHVYAGGGLGAVPHQAQVMYDFLSIDELLPIIQSIGRVFGRMGEKKNRARARIKFLIAKLGLEEFKEIVEKERGLLKEDPNWKIIQTIQQNWNETPMKKPTTVIHRNDDPTFKFWFNTNVDDQKQDGYSLVTIKLPLGDLSSWQMRKLADITEKYTGEFIRTSVEQNFVLRWVSNSDLPELYNDLKKIGLGNGGAGTITDITACPGTDTCKLGIASSRGLASELTSFLEGNSDELDEAVQKLRIKISGCFNSCGQHHIADIGFYGISRNRNGYKVPHFQVILGGEWNNNAGQFGLAIGAVPSKNIPKTILALSDFFIKNRENKYIPFKSFVNTKSKSELKEIIDQFTHIPSFEENPEFYRDWGDPNIFTMGNMGTGECAGEVVALTDMELKDAERMSFEAQIHLENDQLENAVDKSYKSMLKAADALIRHQTGFTPENPEATVNIFKEKLYDTKLFYDKYAKGKFGKYLIRMHEKSDLNVNMNTAKQSIEESQLFIEAAYACYSRLMQANQTGSGNGIG